MGGVDGWFWIWTNVVIDTSLIIVCVSIFRWNSKRDKKTVIGQDEAVQWVPKSVVTKFERSLETCLNGEIIKTIKQQVNRGMVSRADYDWGHLWNDLKPDIPILFYYLTWYKVSYSIYWRYLDPEKHDHWIFQHMFDLLMPIRIDLVLSFILGTAVTETMRHYLHKRVNIRLQMEAVGGCIQNIAMILASINLDDKSKFRHYRQLNAIHFLCYTDTSTDPRYEDIGGLLAAGLINEKEHLLIAKPFVYKMNIALLTLLMKQVTRAKAFRDTALKLALVNACTALRGKMGGGGLKCATQLYPPPAHEFMNKICAHCFLMLLPVMVWEENSGHIPNFIAILVIVLWVNLVLKIMANEDLLDYDPSNPGNADTYAYNPDSTILNTEVAIWTLLFADADRLKYEHHGDQEEYDALNDQLDGLGGGDKKISPTLRAAPV